MLQRGALCLCHAPAVAMWPGTPHSRETRGPEQLGLEHLCVCAGPAAGTAGVHACVLTHSACARLRGGTAGCCLAAPSSQPSQGRACEPRQVGRARACGLCDSRVRVPEQGPCPSAGCRGRWAAVGRHTRPCPCSHRQQQHHPAPSPPSQAPAASGNAGVGIGCRNRRPTCLLTPGHGFWCCPKSQRGFPVAGSGQGGWPGACQCLQQGVGHAQACAERSGAGCCGCPRRCPAGSCVGRTEINGSLA